MNNKDEQAIQLAQAHFAVEPGITRIFRLFGGPDVESKHDEPIMLLEVNRDTIPSGIMPLQFAPAPASGIHFPSVIVEVTPEEFEKITRQELKLPLGWTLGNEVDQHQALGNPG